MDLAGVPEGHRRSCDVEGACEGSQRGLSADDHLLVKMILKRFSEAVLQKSRGMMGEAAAFIEQFDALAAEEGLSPEWKDALKRGMFLILRAKL